MNWQPITRQKLYTLDKGYIVKLNNGQVKSVCRVVGGNLLDNRDVEIPYEDILFFAEKEDKSRYFTLQKHYETLIKFDNDILDDLAYAISSVLQIGHNSLEDEKLTKLFKKLKKKIKQAEDRCLIESKNYL